MKLSDHFSSQRPVLIAVAAFPEVKAALEGLGVSASVERNCWCAYRYSALTILQTSIGKASAAAALSRELTIAEWEGTPYAAVISLGISGSYASLPTGSVVLAESAVLADEGLALSSGFENIEDHGWGRSRFSIEAQPWHEILGATHQGAIVTISTISGTATLAREYTGRSPVPPLAEDMETAALALVCEMLTVPFGAVRIICNECGVPDSFDFSAGFAKLSEVIRNWGFAP